MGGENVLRCRTFRQRRPRSSESAIIGTAGGAAPTDVHFDAECTGFRARSSRSASWSKTVLLASVANC
eukprot:scaffold46110_cov46-Prasinocladus_malaysianus.AAC.1